MHFQFFFIHRKMNVVEKLIFHHNLFINHNDKITNDVADFIMTLYDVKHEFTFS